MISLNLLGNPKEVESKKQDITDLPQVLQDPQELIHHSKCPTPKVT